MCSKFDENNKSLPPETRTLAYLNNKENNSHCEFLEIRDVLGSKRPQNDITVLFPIHCRSSKLPTDAVLCFPGQSFTPTRTVSYSLATQTLQSKGKTGLSS